MEKEKTNLDRLNILLGVTGGVSAYKAVDLASKLTAAGAKIKTIMTESACRFVTEKSFQAVTQSETFTSLWQTSEEYKIGHINLTDWADIIITAPATANILAKIANGICDDLLSTTLCACWNKPKLLAPAMNNNMWQNPAVQRNVKTIKDMGFILIGPEKGRLACGTESFGRMAEPKDIIKEIEKTVTKIKRNKK